MSGGQSTGEDVELLASRAAIVCVQLHAMLSKWHVQTQVLDNVCGKVGSAGSVSCEGKFLLPSASTKKI